MRSGSWNAGNGQLRAFSSSISGLVSIRLGRELPKTAAPHKQGRLMRALYLATVANRVMPAPTPRSCKRSSTLRSESGKRTYSITAKRMISGLVLKYLNGECFVIFRCYKYSPAQLKLVLSDRAALTAPPQWVIICGCYNYTLPASTGFDLMVPLRG